tara:strand:- start:15401 stop:16273 length:873 start_codon:yes stop_codon:yes gene_type:complete
MSLQPVAPTPFDPGNWGEIVDIQTIKRTPVPVQGPQTWRPFPQHQYVEMIEQALTRHGFTNSDPIHYRAPSRDNGKIKDLPEHGRFLSLYGIAHPELPSIEGMSWEVGAVNSYDMSKSVQLGLGNRVAVCSNGQMMGASHAFKRKHTVGINRDFDDHFEMIYSLVDSAVRGLFTQAEKESQRISRFKQTGCEDTDARWVILESAKSGVIGAAQTMKVLKHWEHPEHPEFKDRNAWSLLNAFTSNDRGRNIMTQGSRFTALSDIMDRRFDGLSGHGSNSEDQSSVGSAADF